jgi:sialate O-acetylesterase
MLSPEVVSAHVSDAAIQLTLDQPIQGGDLYTFEVCNNGSDKYQNVPAIGKGNVITLLVPPTSQASSLKIRFAWKDDPKQANVRSLTGLPMSSFELTLSPPE